MDDKDEKRTSVPIITIVERRREGREELSSAEVMRLVRKRSQKKLRGDPGSGSDRKPR
jgi:hypothetical protein